MSMAGEPKAIFAKYEVLVSEIEKYEKDHGPGSAGSTTTSPEYAARLKTSLKNNPLPAVVSSPPAAEYHGKPVKYHTRCRRTR